MRLVRAIKFLILLVLALFLFGGEVVETACFVNDVSNDYIQAPVSPEGRLADIAPGDAFPQRSISLAQESILSFAAIPSIEVLYSPAVDLLQLISIQRT